MRFFSERATFAIFALALAGLAVRGASAQPAPQLLVHHDLTVTLDPANHRLKVRDHIRIPGALVTVYTDKLGVTEEARAGSSYLSSEDPRLHFGFGKATVRSLTVRFPDGTIKRVEGATDKILIVKR